MALARTLLARSSPGHHLCLHHPVIPHESSATPPATVSGSCGAPGPGTSTCRPTGCGRCWPTPIASTRRWACRPMRSRRRRSPTAPCCAAAGQGGGLHPRMGGEALRVDPRPPLPPGARLHQGPVPPLRAGVRYRAGGPAQQGELRARMGAADLGRPAVRQAARGAGGRGRGEAHAGGRRLRQRRARDHFDLPPPELPDGARERAAALAAAIDRSPYGNGLGQQLTDYVLTGMASDLAPLKPKLLAREFGVAQRPRSRPAWPPCAPGC